MYHYLNEFKDIRISDFVGNRYFRKLSNKIKLKVIYRLYEKFILHGMIEEDGNTSNNPDFDFSL